MSRFIEGKVLLKSLFRFSFPFSFVRFSSRFPDGTADSLTRGHCLPVRMQGERAVPSDREGASFLAAFVKRGARLRGVNENQ